MELATNVSQFGSLVRRHRFRLIEALPWVAIVAVYLLFPTSLALGTQVLIMILFALSLDLLLGYAGITSLGHAAFFGLGAYVAGILTVHGVADPLLGLLISALACAFFGLITGSVILRTHGLPLLMLTLGILLMCAEAANRAVSITGGADGLQGMVVGPLLGFLEFDMRSRVAYCYSAVVLAVVFVFVRTLVHAPFGRMLVGIQLNSLRMSAVGTPVRRRLIIVYAIAGAIAGIAGALNAQTNEFVGPTVLSLELSAGVLTMLIFGGVGRLYGAFVGAAFYMVLHDYLARAEPAYWYLWLGVLLIVVVLYGKGGILGWCDRLYSACFDRSVRRQTPANTKEHGA
ncbi:branched-chain amino acid ABC transporter permease [Mesopusillimonas faecipullorum]|nr:branched-chain amino acid ABC transporter permease [Mesopusillimonas faecipullorum]